MYDEIESWLERLEQDYRRTIENAEVYADQVRDLFMGKILQEPIVEESVDSNPYYTPAVDPTTLAVKPTKF